MGHRLSKIVTRTGDTGTTGLTTGERVPKSHPRVGAMGEVDELNSIVGMLLTHEVSPRLREILTRVQHELFNLGGELSMPGSALIKEDDLARLDAAIEEFNATLPPLKEFILPGGTPAAAVCHLARAVTRRVERALWTLHADEALNTLSLQYLNRLSDFLFVASRVLARAGGGKEVSWQKG